LILLSVTEDSIMALQNIRTTGGAAAIITAVSLVLAGCSSAFAPNASDRSFGGTPMALACEPNQRALVRQVVVNGTPQTQLQCETVAAGANGSVGAVAPVVYTPAAVPVGYAQAAIGDARLVSAGYAAPAAAPVHGAPQRVAYQPARERVDASRPTRSVAKSAVIIGSSAGVAAGIGAAIGGTKGAGIGALVGGGGAALWDQLTRHQ
jgi:hypothetical protein